MLAILLIAAITVLILCVVTALAEDIVRQRPDAENKNQRQN